MRDCFQAEDDISDLVQSRGLGGVDKRIDEDNAGSYITQWPVINTQPAKHQGYAVQWFAMSIALVLLYAWLLFKETRDKR